MIAKIKQMNYNIFINQSDIYLTNMIFIFGVTVQLLTGNA